MPRVLSNWMLREKNLLDSTHAFTMAFEVQIPGAGALHLVNYDRTIVFHGIDYVPFPVDVDALEDANSMALVRLRVTIGNVDRQMMALLDNYWGGAAPLWNVTIWQLDAQRPDEVPYVAGDVFLVAQVATNLMQAVVDVQAEGLTLTRTVPGRRFTATGGFKLIPRRIL